MKGKAKFIKGSHKRPRLRVSITLKNIYAQVIDDSLGATLVSASTMDKELKSKKLRPTVKTAATIGEIVGKRAKAKGIKAVVFDRGGKKYHGRVKAAADGARAAGLEF